MESKIGKAYKKELKLQNKELAAQEKNVKPQKPTEYNQAERRDHEPLKEVVKEAAEKKIEVKTEVDSKTSVENQKEVPKEVVKEPEEKVSEVQRNQPQTENKAEKSVKPKYKRLVSPRENQTLSEIKELEAGETQDGLVKYKLGQLYSQVGNYKDALKNYKLAAGHGDAHYLIGNLYKSGIGGVEKNYEKAFKNFELAAKQGDPVARYELGMLYKDGNGVEKDYKEAFKNFELAAKQEVSDAKYELGNLYKDGQGVKKDLKKAAEYYELSAHGSYRQISWDLENLGDLYMKEEPRTLQSYVEALELYSKAIKLPRSGFTKELDSKISNLRAEVRNFTEELKKKANKGDVEAQLNLGQLFDYLEELVPQDYSEAIKYYKLAAKKGNVDAQHNLGSIYAEQNNTTEAIKYFKLAAAQGDEEAKDALEDMQKRT